jgi:prolipoprotein diacylglyceryl transferase
MPIAPFAPLLGSIPSPADNTLDLGPISLSFYGILLAFAVVVGSIVVERRWKRWGHDPREWQQVVVIVVAAGIVGARLYHAATDYEKFEGDWLRIFEIWKGGLSIWGGVLAGVIAGFVVCRIKHYDALGMLDAAAPAVPLAHGIGRWGNWFNQELFGEPTTLPWGLEIDPAHRPSGLERFETFHPIFLYESLFLFALAGALLWVERRWRLKRGQLFALYVAGYPVGRFWFEQLRIDDAKLVLGLRVNSWVALAVLVGGIAWFWWLGRHSTVDEGKYRAIAAGT